MYRGKWRALEVGLRHDIGTGRRMVNHGDERTSTFFCNVHSALRSDVVSLILVNAQTCIVSFSSMSVETVLQCISSVVITVANGFLVSLTYSSSLLNSSQ